MKSDKKRKNHLAVIVISCIVFFVLLILGSIYLFLRGIAISVTSAEKAYSRTLAEETEKTAQEYYNWAFHTAEEDYHASSEVAITIGEIEGQAKLEVLKVSDVEFIIQNAGEDGSDITAWVAIPGDGVFTVDMTMSEFLIDNARHMIVVRIPQPTLTECRVESGNIEVYELETGKIINGTYAQGTSLAQEHLQKGEDMIRKEFLSNQQYLLSAQQSAEMLITNLIRNLNPRIEDLKVEIEFVD